MSISGRNRFGLCRVRVYLNNFGSDSRVGSDFFRSKMKWANKQQKQKEMTKTKEEGPWTKQKTSSSPKKRENEVQKNDVGRQVSNRYVKPPQSKNRMTPNFAS